VTIPGPLLNARRLIENVGPTRPPPDGSQAADMHLRFQVPAEVLPLRVERARLTVRITAPGRPVVVSGHKDGAAVELLRVESPLDAIQYDLTEEALLRLDEQGGLHLRLNVGTPVKVPEKGKRDILESEKWTIEYLELEVTGVCQ
jgi:hypothetical protein